MKAHDDIRALASGIKFALDTMYRSVRVEFMLVTVVPKGDGEVTINTITAITDPDQVRQIGQHLVEMSIAQAASAGMTVDDDSDIKGHA